ncbi:MAG: hypothetical protein E7580_00205 [Ruminococcaceae bacterium]|nr:hypothetical protein [Oscillospiraceae bacterium]
MMKLFLPKSTDQRFVHLAKRAKEEGFSVIRQDMDFTEEQGVFFLPFGAGTKDCINALSRIPAGSFVFLGKADDSVKQYAKQHALHLTGLLEDKGYLLQNSNHTAEGTLAEILEKTDRRLDQLCFLIYGYGNCGKAIARLLWLCGCEIWICSRARGQALARKDGFNVFPAPEKGLGMFDGVINTVPEPIFSRELLATMQQDSFFFQVASGFSGIDPKETEKLRIRFTPLHGLPGKYCPASEADAIWEVVERTLNKPPTRSTL